jgi:copper chaperone CopZ
MILQRLKLSNFFSSNMTSSILNRTPLGALYFRNSSAFLNRMGVLNPVSMNCIATFGSTPDIKTPRSVGITPRLGTPLLTHLPHRKFNRLPSSYICASLSTVTLEKETSEVEAFQNAASPIVLTVKGMKCGGCSAAVKRMLLQQPGISSAAVNLLTETAVIQVVADSPAEVAEQAASVLGSKGFPAELRKAEEDDIANAATAINERKAQELKDS